MQFRDTVMSFIPISISFLNVEIIPTVMMLQNKPTVTANLLLHFIHVQLTIEKPQIKGHW